LAGDHAIRDGGEDLAFSESEIRLGLLESTLAELTEPTADAVLAILQQRPLCRIGSADAGGQTIHTQILVASEPPVLHLSAGRPDQYPLHRFDFSSAAP
jgi:hypothetical protein